MALNCIFDGRSITGNCTHVTPTTKKSQYTYASLGSERQAIVELLSLTEVLLQNNPNIQHSVMLKKCRHMFRPYFYLSDILLRTNCDIRLDTNKDGYNHELIGSFVLSLIMHQLYNMQLFVQLDSSTTGCGWKGCYSTSNVAYHPYICPQKYSTNVQQLKKHHRICHLQRNLEPTNTVTSTMSTNI